MKPATLSMTASKWNVDWSEFMPSHPTQDGAGWKINLPQGIGEPQTVPELDYLTCNHTVAIKASAIEMQISVVANPDVYLDYKTEPGNETGGIPASTRFLIYRDMSSEFGRWWSNPYFISLAPGVSTTLRVPLVPSNWSSVFGKFGNASFDSLSGFNRCLAAPKALGMTFGGGNFFSHGLISRNGASLIKCSSYKLIS